MTGFGAGEGQVAGGRVRVEIRSVNHRYLLVSLKAPSEFGPHESSVRDRLRQRFERGHLTVQVRWLEEPTSTAGPRVRLEVDRAREAMARLRELKTAVGINGDITLELVARQPDVFVTIDQPPPSLPWEQLEAVIDEAADECRGMRAREGEVLTAELLSRVAALRQRRDDVATRGPERLVRERNRLRDQIRDLLDGRAVDEQRLEQELALLADRLDVTEELVRLSAHLDACATSLTNDGAVGKRLGFLAQEMGREVNTIGSKANDAAIQHTVVDMKGELERFREQLENLE
jgi:uncharacterized protein (TIGR00255 family)